MENLPVFLFQKTQKKIGEKKFKIRTKKMRHEITIIKRYIEHTIFQNVNNRKTVPYYITFIELTNT